MTWDTAANIINDAAVELGLRSSDLSNPFDSTEANIIQLCRFLRGAGQDLAREFPWSHLQKATTVTTVNGTASYSLPADFARMADGTHWNRTQIRPLAGPLGAQGWQQAQAQSIGSAVDKYFRVFGNLLQLYPTPTAAETLAYEYISTYWVQPNGQSSATTETPSAGSDTLHFDRRLLVAALKLPFLKAKGFDTTSAQADYDRAFARASGADGAAPTLRIGGRSASGALSANNLPDTGFGS